MLPAAPPAAPPPRQRRPLPQFAAPRPTTTPSFTLTGLVLAHGWLLLAALLLPTVVPLLVAGAWNAPPVIGVVHVVTLGVVATGIVAALGQVGPGILGVGLPSVGRARAARGALTLAVPLVSWGTWSWSPVTIGMGWGCAAVATALLVRDLARPLLREAPRAMAPRVVAVGGSFALLTLLLAGARLGVALDWWSLSPSRLAAAHAQAGLIGFGSLVAGGITRHVLPAFLGVPVGSPRASDWPLALTLGVLPLLILGTLLGAPWLQAVGGGALAVAATGWIGWAHRMWRGRARPHDMPAQLLAAATVPLLIGALVGAGTLLATALGTRWPARMPGVIGVLLLPGWLVGLIVAVSGRLVPRLAAIATRDMDGRRGGGDRCWLAVGGHAVAVGSWGLALGIATGSVAVAHGGAALLLAGAAVLFGRHGRTLGRTRASANPARGTRAQP